MGTKIKKADTQEILDADCIFGMKEYAKLVELGRMTVFRYIDQGRIRKIKIGGRSFVYDETLKRK